MIAQRDLDFRAMLVRLLGSATFIVSAVMFAGCFALGASAAYFGNTAIITNLFTPFAYKLSFALTLVGGALSSQYIGLVEMVARRIETTRTRLLEREAQERDEALRSEEQKRIAKIDEIIDLAVELEKNRPKKIPPR